MKRNNTSKDNLKRMLKQLSEIKNTVKLKVAAVAFDADDMEFINVATNDSKGFSKTNKKRETSIYHAEQILLENYEGKKKINIMVNIPPCEYCMKVMNEYYRKGVLDKVYYIGKYQLQKKIDDLQILSNEKPLFELIQFNPTCDHDIKSMTNKINKFYEGYYFVEFALVWIRLNLINKKFKVNNLPISNKELIKSKVVFDTIEKMTGFRVLYNKSRRNKDKHFYIKLGRIISIYNDVDESMIRKSIRREKKLLRSLNDKDNTFLHVKEFSKYEKTDGNKYYS